MKIKMLISQSYGIVVGGLTSAFWNGRSPSSVALADPQLGSHQEIAWLARVECFVAGRRPTEDGPAVLGRTRLPAAPIVVVRPPLPQKGRVRNCEKEDGK